MKIIKIPFCSRTYAFTSESPTGSDEVILKEWLDSIGEGRYKVVGINMLEITDPTIETMFILKWYKS